MKEKMRRNFWISSEIECMLNLLREVYRIQGTTATTNYTFIQIANKMKKKGFPNKSATQIRRKWFQMKSAYLCYKRGNVERLLLIPEKFRPIIAQFVDKEIKPNYRELSPSPEPEPAPQPTPSPPPAPAPVQTPITTYNRLRDTSNARSGAKSVNNDLIYDDFFSEIKQTHKIINSTFSNMQKILMDFEHECQAERDAKLITFINSMKYDF
ncbi:PREDICTED: uncharacterized protein LOC108976972 [Bactrocera latifrons]|uniref:Myb/SANT-like DNA-binding domain-containing protein n=1 Tax=Bactrocera latifrons TaxID=174628 RepID=A0A0K8VTJ4_BACLA|nr:PREDICTED: uncharacterized protein LOC108976972 [Bactrocera latifrons]